jgi:hypothetical protein
MHLNFAAQLGTSKVYELLGRFNAAACIFEIAGVQSPSLLTADFVYVCLHGPGKACEGSYSGPVLRKWAKQVESSMAPELPRLLLF